jgi:hypothetical protein
VAQLQNEAKITFNFGNSIIFRDTLLASKLHFLPQLFGGCLLVYNEELTLISKELTYKHPPVEGPTLIYLLLNQAKLACTIKVQGCEISKFCSWA